MIQIEYLPTSSLNAAPYNPRKMPDDAMARLMRGIEAYGIVDPIIVNQTTGNIVGGHQRVEAAKRLKLAEVPVVHVSLDRDQEKALNLALNKISGEWDIDLLRGILGDLSAEDFDLELTGFSAGEVADLLAGGLEGDGIEREFGEGDSAATAADDTPRASLADRFLVPPFSVLDARQGYWQSRKRAWLGLGIKSELGRGENAAPGGSSRDAMTLGDDGKTQRGDGAGKPMGNGLLGESEQARSHYGKGKDPARCFGQDLMRGEHTVGKKPAAAAFQSPGGDYPHPTEALDAQSGTSIFDPVLCELAYLWFSPAGGTVLDPFAGGSVRGVVAAKLGREYVGMELRAEQVEANRDQWTDLAKPGDAPPTWHIGDSRSIASLIGSVKADLLFSCPPYADLEVYSDDPSDLSTLPYGEFLSAYRAIIAASVSMLKPNRFACFVVGDIRDAKGMYRNFVSDTIAAFHDAGAKLYNEAILVTAVGSLPIRAGKQFAAGRKLGKTHQNVLVFVKGDPKKATDACGPVDVVDLAEQFGEAVE